jgi:hypothetical protein
MARKRKDPADHPVDSDMRRDVVKNVPKDVQPLLLTPEDAAMWREWGAVKEERREGSMRLAFDPGDETTSGFQTGGLTLYKIKKSVFDKRQGNAHAEDSQRMSTIKKQARMTPGGEYVETRE